jgi:hypothetical protein
MHYTMAAPSGNKTSQRIADVRLAWLEYRLQETPGLPCRVPGSESEKRI